MSTPYDDDALSPRQGAGPKRIFDPPSGPSSDTEDDAPLPFPTALPRSDFLGPEFDPARYLSSLSNRHQTLEDLRADLRERSAAISGELLELVNANYTAFLGLGSELKGGEERVEDVRVGLLGFRRAVDEVRAKVSDRVRDVAALNDALNDVRSDIEVGRHMLELTDRLDLLEACLAIDGTQPESEDSEEEREDDDGYVGTGSSAVKLAALSHDYTTIEELAESIGKETPFVKKMGERMVRCRNTILLDLGAALKEARKAGPQGQGRMLNVMGLYALINAQADAVKALKAI